VAGLDAVRELAHRLAGDADAPRLPARAEHLHDRCIAL
jgi:hypothetical protein